MKILVISNVYPPYFIGGYELGCQEVVEALKARGHEVKVLTSSYGLNTIENDNTVYRWLETDLSWENIRSYKYIFKVTKKEIINQRVFKKIVKIHKPDVVYMWNLSHISISLAFLAKKMKLPVSYFVFDDWLSLWEQDTWYSLWNQKILRYVCGFCKRLLNSFFIVLRLPQFLGNIDLGNVQFASHYLKQLTLEAGKTVTREEIIYWGIDINDYTFRDKYNIMPKRLLYVGQIIPHKGVLTAVDALKFIVQKYDTITLTIVGGSVMKDYEEQVHKYVHSLGLENNIRFTGLISHENMPHIYNEHDILVFPSIWDEPFGITLLEAMASGLAIVGTATGGSAEILNDEINALVFPKENVQACANQILRLIEDPGLFNRLIENAHDSIKQKFSFANMMNKIEDALYDSLR